MLTSNSGVTGRGRVQVSFFLVALLVLFAPGLAPAGPHAQAESAATAAQEPRAGASNELHLMVGRSLVITSPARVKRVSIADPNIADAVIVTPNQLLINGKAPGGVSLVLWDENDLSQTFDIFVDLDILGISQKVREAFPQERVRVEATKDVVILMGSASSKPVAEQVLQLVSAATPKVISLIEVPLPPAAGEILLEVKFAEVNRSAVHQLGLNVFSLNKEMIGAVSTQQFSPPRFEQATTQNGKITEAEFSFTDVLNIFAINPHLNLGATIRALEQKNLLQILAEPNLLTQSGKEAHFLAGGEFPFPILQAGTTGTGITIQFKEFGVRLSFTPTQTAEGKIHLKVRPEVSALDFANALTISGFLIPALSTRRVESEMELQDGQSFAIAGLVDDRLVESVQKIPFLGDIPLLGKLFRSRSQSKTKTELIVVVTPRLVKPMTAGQVPQGPQFPKPFMPPAVPEKPVPPKEK
jgi:pilus assembly protein CpaC